MVAVDALETTVAHEAKGRTLAAVQAREAVPGGTTANLRRHATVDHAQTTAPATMMHSLHGPMRIWEPTWGTAPLSTAMQAMARVDNLTLCVPVWIAWPNAVAAVAVDTAIVEAATVVVGAMDHAVLVVPAAPSIANHSSRAVSPVPTVLLRGWAQSHGKGLVRQCLDHLRSTLGHTILTMKSRATFAPHYE